MAAQANTPRVDFLELISGLVEDSFYGVQLNETVQQLKQRIESTMGRMASTYNLYLNNVPLTESQTLAAGGVTAGSVIQAKPVWGS